MKIHPKLKQIICIWIALFPTSIIVNLLFSDLLNNLNFIARIFITTIIIVPLMVLYLIPFTNKLISNWIK